MRNSLVGMMLTLAVSTWFAATAVAANKETINTVDAYIGQNGVTVDVFCHNEDDLFEYFNLIVFDDTKLDYVSIAADRGILWYGFYPTHVSGNRIYVHGVAGNFGDCINPDLGEPGSPLYHIAFNVKPGVEGGLAGLVFAVEPIWDGHWNDCSGSGISPTPDYYDGGVNILGPAGHVTIESDSTSPGEQVAVDVYLHNDLDVFEYFNQILFEDAIADVDSIVAVRGALHYGNYPTHVSGDTIFVHGWASGESCFGPDHSFPGGSLYRIYFTIDGFAPPSYVMPLTFLPDSPLWNHWVGCDLTTTDAFDATDGSIRVLVPTGIEPNLPRAANIRLEHALPNPSAQGAVISYYLTRAGRADIAIYDVAGRTVRTVAHGPHAAGWHHASWDGMDDNGSQVVSGVYFYRLQAGAATLSKKLVVAR